ncbi:MAG: hypothetical protein BGO28_03795 [Alphaproteobacteria bacterium 43-37]|nr:MAG: hypothetical protein BGO28_03795 [Alphaproteobacteria bacterium 43-37]
MTKKRARVTWERARVTWERARAIRKKSEGDGEKSEGDTGKRRWRRRPLHLIASIKVTNFRLRWRSMTSL